VILKLAKRRFASQSELRENKSTCQFTLPSQITRLAHQPLNTVLSPHLLPLSYNIQTLTTSITFIHNLSTPIHFITKQPQPTPNTTFIMTGRKYILQTFIIAVNEVFAKNALRLPPQHLHTPIMNLTNTSQAEREERDSAREELSVTARFFVTTSKA